ncbi:MAG: hypothetical protein H6Q72_919 [Firmicutes bacterium]|nr:hypothetical protein [Bacillota bacterium]
MARHETTHDLTDSKFFETDIAKTGNVIVAVINTEHSKTELVMDAADFAEFIQQGALILNKKKGAA